MITDGVWMLARILSDENNELTIELKLPLKGSMLECEDAILDGLNEVGTLATEKALSKFDADGSPIHVGKIKLTARSRDEANYQTPYGVARVKRYVYQTSKGGKIFCPLEDKARIIQGSTPRFAKIISHKYSNLPAPSVIDDLKVNHNRKISHSYLQRATDFVGGIAQAKEAEWEYEEPKLDAGVEMLSISLDGAYVLTVDDGYRESMVGTISMYDKHGARLHTTYVAASPEYGKDEFFNRLEKEIKLKKKYYPDAKTIGVADGAKNNWPFLKKHTDTQILDFWHATEYLGEASKAVFTKKSERDERDVWLEERCHDLKHKKGAAGRILAELKEHLNKKLNKSLREKLEGTITYFENNIKEKRMSYHNLIKQNAPIGSGVTEAACKTIVKQRLGGSGMRWKDKGMKIVLCLRTLVKTKGRWDQFWEKVNDFGVPAAI